MTGHVDFNQTINLNQSKMSHSPFTNQQLRVFAEDLLHSFVEAGFDVLEEPYIDQDLGGFRVTYIRRYLLHKPTPTYDGILTTLIHVIGVPFGHQGHKMVIMAMPRNIKNEPVAETIKLRIHFDETSGIYRVVHGEHQHVPEKTNNKNKDDVQSNLFMNSIITEIQSNQQQLDSASSSSQTRPHKPPYKSESEIEFANQLDEYVAHILETISPGLIELPFELKLEVLKKLSVGSIIKMSQVNSEFRALIFVHGESLWRHLCRRDFNIKTINRSLHKSWMELYRDTYVLHELEICRKERALPGLPERPALPPAPYMLQIGWLPEAHRMQFLPIDPIDPMMDLGNNIALEWAPLRRIDSLDSLR